MAWIVDYVQVLEQMQSLGLRSLYFNSGAFGFPKDAATHSAGWTGPEDPTLRPAAKELTVAVPAPYEAELARRVVRVWKDLVPGKMWVMPKSHWAYELDFGGPDWMPPLLERVGIDAGMLQPRTNAAAIEFSPDEAANVSHLLEGLLRQMFGSDFALAFPGYPVTCTLHHHKQVWWTSTDGELVKRLREAGEDKVMVKG